jgi:hypothetical protein
MGSVAESKKRLRELGVSERGIEAAWELAQKMNNDLSKKTYWQIRCEAAEKFIELSPG